MRIAIIGAGFCGNLLAAALARQGTASRLTLIGVADTFGRGIAYGAARPEHLLNVRAKDLGVDPQDPGGFADALQLDAGQRLDFLPRLRYGRYLEQHLDAALASSAVEVARVSEEAVAVERGPDGFRIFLANGEDVVSDVVVLAIGALPPAALPGIGPRLAVHRRYIGWPWQDGVLDEVPPQARLLLVGTGLTMADVALTLRRRGHRGPITALSRRGLAPQAHLAHPGAPVTLPPRVAQALRNHDLTGLVRSLRQLTTVVEDWRCVVDALRPHLQPFWKGLAPAARSRFLRHLRPYWEVARHRLAPAAATALAQMQQQGQLRIRAGRLLRARLGEHAVEAVIRDRASYSARTEDFDVLIRATGLDTDVARTSHPLIATMRDAGLLQADPLGLGLVVDARLQVRDGSGHPVAGLYCLGPLLRGGLWEITAVPELRAGAQRLAAELAALGQAWVTGGGVGGEAQRQAV
ncbi:pyridine nucleotide-disulfide oxidoreductase [Xanthomonas cerealis pv. cerealis]|uniref:Pyridine nucleotide-disulfide oxidoreductase n=1 Tax=Xanthomonas cerealis pv. cerealis TaxID=152263 RepID=A0A514EFQ7_9XANT|nr:FAD/NAD(P)-binding protein [Xanthomonas translucens]QDI04864.1 pyridine nucleotide-disulfide oxidoreductase [Xanthomonas translucens pv. cerealis]